MVDSLLILGLLALTSWISLIAFLFWKRSKIQEVSDLALEEINLLGQIQRRGREIWKKSFSVIRQAGLITNKVIQIINKSKKKDFRVEQFKEEQEHKFQDQNYWQRVRKILRKK